MSGADIAARPGWAEKAKELLTLKQAKIEAEELGCKLVEEGGKNGFYPIFKDGVDTGIEYNEPAKKWTVSYVSHGSGKNMFQHEIYLNGALNVAKNRTNLISRVEDEVSE